MLRSTALQNGCFLVLRATFVMSLLAAPAAIAEERDASAVEKRLTDSVRYLASDELEGRGVGTAGIDKAADFIAAEFANIGLNTKVFSGSPFQAFRITTAAEMGPKKQNHLKLVGPGGDKPRVIEFELNQDFNPLAIGGSGKFNLPLVFVGYGITAKEPKYDDYAGIDVKGKAVLILRKEPQQNNPHSPFNGKAASRHALFSTKVSNAYQHGAAAVIMVNDALELTNREQATKKSFDKAVADMEQAIAKFRELENPSEEDRAKHRQALAKLGEQIKNLADQLNEGQFDQIVAFNGAGNTSARKGLPVVFCSRAAIEPLIKAALNTDLSSIEKKIDQSLEPQSRQLTGWTASGETKVVHKEADVKNVVGVLPGEGPLADETVVVGAHYDHLGRGGAGSLAPWTKDIHNGADDNASGTAALIEVARMIAGGGKPKRRIVFIAFTGEERGLLGSAHYVREPRFALENTVAMINMDMVGRMTDDKLIVHGTGTATRFDKLVDNLNNKYGFKITKQPGGFGPSDHSSFYGKKIPVMHLFTGTHKDYHRPSDDADKLNVVGMRKVSEMVAEIVGSIAQTDARPHYLETKQPVAQRGGSRPYLGSIPDFSQTVEGYALGGVAAGGPAEKAGMKAGDVIVKFGKSKIGSLEDIDSALRKYKAGDKVPVVVMRKGKPVALNVILGAPR